MELLDRILEYMREEAYNPMLISELAGALKVDEEAMSELEETLKYMESDGYIIKTRKKRYGLPERMNLIVGRLQGSQKGFGFLIPDNPDIRDLYIPVENLNGAMHNDRVIARITKGSIGTMKSEGEIIRILKRANEQIVGTFESNKRFGFVVPDDARIYQDIFISREDFEGAKDGYKVVVQITRWPEGRRNPEGKIIEILGHRDDAGTDILSIIRGHNLPEEFPADVEVQASRIPEEVRSEALSSRKDLRNRKIATIDGEDAKDLDDAVSLEVLPNGNYFLGVHIADVSQYVFEGSPLDNEALKRGTSVYLVDRVIPMLPKKLSNGICSLNPKVDRLTLSCDMEIDNKGNVVKYDIYESIIRTSERMTYKNVNKILEDEDEELKARYKEFIDTFKNMEQLMNILRKKRRIRGSIDFDFEESKIILDDKGKPVDIRPYERGVSERIIEEFMIVCNETIAEHMYWKEMPFVYRVHEDPDPEKIMVLNVLIHNFGYSIKGADEIHPKALQQVLDKVAGKKEERLINTLLLRSLRKARYDGGSLGHFGLASKYYCHFTSPIRRYPDLMIHRIIKEDIHRKLTPGRIRELKEMIPGIAEQSSIRERAAEEAEREVEDLKKAEYMKDRIGEEYEGIISSVTSFGMYVELENTIEGLVHVSNMEDDYYIFDETSHVMIGERKRKIYRIGDMVRIRVLSVDMASHKVDFVLAEC
ncbi:ribonuclease R [Lutispora saccharofermentans]|uniref:Ribonuclease R n=1 Tax=Lutispora saccharofermentans TaxID=3024236 RepID=A0ABT1NB34_9FIRM|nr:ribonuclease R [Lutispora saccharofermentans]MCQ1528326.1 ribonuclease R [Lutispora saccharofermentans]